MNVCEDLIQREQQERVAISAATSEVLSKLNVSIDKLPQKCQQLLQQVCIEQALSGLEQLDLESISLQQSREIADELDDVYEIIKLRQKNDELQVKIDRNKKFLNQLRNDLEQSRENLSKLTPNPESIQEQCRQIKLKVASYEDSWEKMRVKFSKMSIPENTMPKELATLATSLSQLTETAATLRHRAEDIELERQTRDALLKTHSMCFGDTSLRKH